MDWLEQPGIPHRDIKPENVGIAPIGRGDQLHLVLFDFSLARTPAESITAGTVPYLDPFIRLRRPPRCAIGGTCSSRRSAHRQQPTLAIRII